MPLVETRHELIKYSKKQIIQGIL